MCKESRYWCDTCGTTHRRTNVELPPLVRWKSKWKIRVGNQLKDMHHLYMGLWRFLYTENLYYFPDGALEVCPYLHVPRVKREPKYTLIEFVEAAKTMENWAGIEPCSRLLK